jgi:hypothetical protein
MKEYRKKKIILFKNYIGRRGMKVTQFSLTERITM